MLGNRTLSNFISPKILFYNGRGSKMVKTVTDTAIEEEKFRNEAVKILKSLGCPIFGLTKKRIFKMMAKKGYKRGYNGVWIMDGDLIPDEI